MTKQLKLSILISLMSIFPNMYAQSYSKGTSLADTILSQIAHNTATIVQQSNEMDPNRGRYKMYPTENIHNFLKLDTSTGRIEQVQWSLKKDKEFSVWINTSYLSYFGKIGTFELYPTQNMYQFILLDTTDGRVWHIQWGHKPSERWIQRIY